jgi:GntR family transcriptional regulator, transcriptional repressor for pyruvate dehydrogenase complex
MSRTKIAPSAAPLLPGPVARATVVDTVSERLESEILSGRYAAGMRLPAERDLALAFGVNRLTLRASLARLEAHGFIATRHGAGTVVLPWRERVGLDVLPILLRALKPDELVWNELMIALLEIRRLLVAEAIGLATARHTKADLVALRKIGEAQRARVGDPLAFARGEIEFQRAIVRAAGNIGLELVLNTFARFPDALPQMVHKLYDQCEAAVEFYDVVISVLESGDPDAARDGIRYALTAADEAWCKRHQISLKTRKAAPKAKARK